ALRVLDVPPSDERAEVEARLADRVEGFVSAVGDAIAAAVAAGDLAVDDPQLAAKFLWGAWNGVLALHLREDRLALGDKELDQALELGLRIIVEGMAPRDPKVL